MVGLAVGRVIFRRRGDKAFSIGYAVKLADSLSAMPVKSRNRT
jgi:hypothetical protein